MLAMRTSKSRARWFSSHKVSPDISYGVWGGVPCEHDSAYYLSIFVLLRLTKGSNDE
jgi:hypothetical protein